MKDKIEILDNCCYYFYLGSDEIVARTFLNISYEHYKYEDKIQYYMESNQYLLTIKNEA